MNPDQFDRAALAAGTKHKLTLDIADGVALPVLVVRGAKPGKVLAVSAGVHGDEYEGVRAIFEVFAELNPAVMTGDLIAAPTANPPAFWAGTRTSPVDRENLARVFPGSPEGTLSHRIAHHFARAVIRGADFFLDLHSGGVKYRMPSMVGYDSRDPRGTAAARVFGAPVIWGHPTLAAGRSVSYAHEQGVPWLYTEARGAGRIHPEDLAMMTTGIRNLLRHLAILPGQPEISAPSRRLRGLGDTDQGMAATTAGFLMNAVKNMDSVSAGQLLGRIVNVQGDTLEEFRSPAAGVIGMIREFPVVQPGDPLYLIAQDDPA